MFALSFFKNDMTIYHNALQKGQYCRASYRKVSIRTEADEILQLLLPSDVSHELGAEEARTNDGWDGNSLISVGRVRI